MLQRELWSAPVKEEGDDEHMGRIGGAPKAYELGQVINSGRRSQIGEVNRQGYPFNQQLPRGTSRSLHEAENASEDTIEPHARVSAASLHEQQR